MGLFSSKNQTSDAIKKNTPFLMNNGMLYKPNSAQFNG